MCVQEIKYKANPNTSERDMNNANPSTDFQKFQQDSALFEEKQQILLLPSEWRLALTFASTIASGVAFWWQNHVDLTSLSMRSKDFSGYKGNQLANMSLTLCNGILIL